MEQSTAREIADSFRIRGSATIEICGGSVGLTVAQESKLKQLEERQKLYFENVYAGLVSKAKPLSLLQEADLKDLIHKRDNPELTEGAKTHCKKWLKQTLYGRREQLKNKYVNKGNEGEEDAFTLMAVQLKLGMVYKNTERRRNEFSEGECDLNHNSIVYDNKCSWSLDTFPMFETEIPDPKYWWQLQNYSTLWDADKLCLCYTLINSSFEAVEDAVRWISGDNEKYKIAERMVFTKPEFELAKSALFPGSTLETFIEIPEDDRIKPFYFDVDKPAQKLIEQRSYMCREYIYNLLTH